MYLIHENGKNTRPPPLVLGVGKFATPNNFKMLVEKWRDENPSSNWEEDLDAKVLADFIPNRGTDIKLYTQKTMLFTVVPTEDVLKPGSTKGRPGGAPGIAYQNIYSKASKYHDNDEVLACYKMYVDIHSMRACKYCLSHDSQSVVRV